MAERMKNPATVIPEATEAIQALQGSITERTVR